MISASELYTGVEKWADPPRERSKGDLLLRTVVELPFDSDAARQAARVRAELESAGQPIGPYDTLLAGQALAAGPTLVTANTNEIQSVSHFSRLQ